MDNGYLKIPLSAIQDFRFIRPRVNPEVKDKPKKLLRAEEGPVPIEDSKLYPHCSQCEREVEEVSWIPELVKDYCITENMVEYAWKNDLNELVCRQCWNTCGGSCSNTFDPYSIDCEREQTRAVCGDTRVWFCRACEIEYMESEISKRKRLVIERREAVKNAWNKRFNRLGWLP